MKIIFLVIIIVLIFIYLLHKYYSRHYWYNVNSKLGEVNYYSSNSFSNGSVIEKNIDKLDIKSLINLYKDYFASFNITEDTIKYFFKTMNQPVVIYKKEVEIIASVFNSINSVIYGSKLYLVNFVDYAIVSKKVRNRNIFQGLMNEVANYTNVNNCRLIMFKIDVNPIPSFMGYNFMSKYYYGERRDMGKIGSKIEVKNIGLEYFKKIISFMESNFVFYPIIEESSNLYNILVNNSQRITIIVEDRVILNFKYNSSNFLELMYIFNIGGDDMMILDGIRFINKNYNFRYLFMDGIGYNIKLLNLMGDYFREKHDTYHYILGINDKLDKSKVYYYF